jgi:Flp pilus assembly protein TadG
VRHRQRAQTIGLAAVSLVAMVGMLAFVIDAGMLFMAHREAQDAADAAALAGVRDLSNGASTCSGACSDDVNRYAAANYAILSRLCDQPGNPTASVGSLNTPIAQTLTVTVSCNASLTFGRILWSAGNSPTFAVQATAVAAVGNAVIGANGLPTGDLTDFKANPSCSAPSCAVSGATGNVLTFGGTGFQPKAGDLIGYTLQFTDALNNATFQITNNTTTTIQVVSSFPPVPAGSHFTILEHSTRLIH